MRDLSFGLGYLWLLAGRDCRPGRPFLCDGWIPAESFRASSGAVLGRRLPQGRALRHPSSAVAICRFRGSRPSGRLRRTPMTFSVWRAGPHCGRLPAGPGGAGPRAVGAFALSFS